MVLSLCLFELFAIKSLNVQLLVNRRESVEL